MEQVVTIRKAVAKDYPSVTTLLIRNELPVEDINAGLPDFLVAEVGSAITGCAGLESYGEYALLRSVVVDKDHRNGGLATQLVNQLLDYAREQGMKKIFLITNTAESYFERKGFVATTRESVPETVLQSREFNGLCPSSAVIMVRSL